MTALPNVYPFSLFLSSKNPEDVMPYPKARPSAPIPNSAEYDMPYLEPDEVERIGAVIGARGVVDPLSVVFWGGATEEAIARLVSNLGSWERALLSSPQWGFRRSAGGNNKIETRTSLAKREGFIDWVRRGNKRKKFFSGTMFESFAPSKKVTPGEA